MGNAFRHLQTVVRHRRAVRRLCFKCGIPWRGILHDLSKFSPAEFLPGARYWLGTASPQVKEREVEGYSAAWMHHQGRNKHHFEYWRDYVSGKGEVPVEMPPVYLAEMFCDRVGATKVYMGEAYEPSAPLAYFERNLGHYRMHEKTAEDLGLLLRMLAERGEDEACAYVRENVVKKNRKNRS